MVNPYVLRFSEFQDLNRPKMFNIVIREDFWHKFVMHHVLRITELGLLFFWNCLTYCRWGCLRIQYGLEYEVNDKQN
jgi:hypothetical protein